MADDVLINKAATIERCVARAREEYAVNPAGFASDYTRQDAAILNIQRACEAALDMGQHLIRRERLGWAYRKARAMCSLCSRKAAGLRPILPAASSAWLASAISQCTIIKRCNCRSR